MKFSIYPVSAFLFFLLSTHQLSAQTDSTKIDRGKLYSVSGVGFGFTAGPVNDVLKPKFSSNIGLDIEVGNGPVFLYTAFDFLSLKYNQLNKTSPDDFMIENGNSTFYIFTLAPGYRKQLGKISIYGFLGPGIGLVSEPRVNLEQDVAAIKNEYHFTATGRGGIGIDYYLGRTLLFIEGGYLHNFRKIEDRSVNVIPVFVGLKSDVSGIFKIFKRTP